MKKIFFCPLFIFLLCLHASSGQSIEKVAPGIWKVVYGTPEQYLPSEFKEGPALKLAKLPAQDSLPFRRYTVQEAQWGALAERKGKSGKERKKQNKVL